MIDFIGVEKNFADKTILNRISFRINSGERVGLVGPNGAGKSTIFNLITGELTPDRGEVVIPKRMRIGYLKQQLLASDLDCPLLDYTADAVSAIADISSEIEEIESALEHYPAESEERQLALNRLGVLQTEFEHLGGYRLRPEAEAALCSLGFNPADMVRPMNDFSGGWQMRATLARTLIADPDILLLDEPSNYLDVPAVEWLCKFLRSYKGTIVLISHDRFMLDKLTSVTLELSDGQITRYNGSYTVYREEREARKVALDAAKKNIEKRKKDLERNIERFRYKSSKASQAQSWQKQLDKIADVVTISDDLSYRGAIRFPEPPPCGAEAARFEHVTFGYDPAKPVLRDVSLNINHGEKIAFIGYNGMGKTTLLKLLAGVLKPQEGRVVPGHNVIIGYQAQEFGELLPGEMSVFDVVRAACGRDFPVASLPNVLGSFGFSGSDQSKLCKVLSGGEKIRLCFARIFVNPPNLLVLDEPTTHLDISAREMLQNMVKSYKGTVCFVSHDIEFIRGTAELIFTVTPSGVRKYFGNYDYYTEKLAQENAAAAPVTAAEQPRGGASDARNRRRERAQERARLAPLRRSLERRIAVAEAEIDKKEARKKELLELLSGGGNVDYAGCNRELGWLDHEIEELSAEWESAATELMELQEKTAEQER